MCDFIACFALWVTSGLGRVLRTARQRVRECFAPPAPPRTYVVLPQAPVYDRRPLPEHVRVRREPLDGEVVALVRPYLLAHERRVEQRLQRERRTAAVLATVGIDYDVARAVS